MIATTTTAHTPEWHDARAAICAERAEKATPGGQFQNYLTKCAEYHLQQAAIGRDDVDGYLDDFLARSPTTEAGL